MFDRWRLKIEIADRHNILCHCRQCGQEWVTSTRDASCRCGSRDIESIPCWQFPDG
nr:hydrogenase maturation nickel metallochaperone HypA [Spirulina major]